jgi:hypothetical protein
MAEVYGLKSRCVAPIPWVSGMWRHQERVVVVLQPPEAISGKEHRNVINLFRQRHLAFGGKFTQMYNTISEN